MLLTTTAEKIQLVLAGAVTTNELQWTTSFVDITSSAFTPGSNDGVSNGTTDVDIVAAPASSTQRQAKVISVYNADTASATVTIKFDDTGTERIYFKTTLSPGETLYWSQETGWSIIPEASILRGDHAVVSGRLTLTSGTPVTTSDVTAAGTVYFTPYAGNRIGLYDGTDWSILSFPEASLSLSGLTASTNYDLFGYDSSSSLTLESVAWSGAATRATALTTQDGVLVKNGDTTRRYLGTIRITSAGGVSEDSAENRFVWNMYNRRMRPLRIISSASWSYALATVRQANADSTYQVEFVVGLVEDEIEATLITYFENSTAGSTAVNGFGLNSTTTLHTSSLFGSYAAPASAYFNNVAAIKVFPDLGYNFLTWLEASPDANTITWYGSSASKRNPGIAGSILG